ncbi:Kinesin light chain [Metarhizium anisopliae]
MWTHSAAIKFSDVYRTQGRLGDAAIMLRMRMLGVAKIHGASHPVVVSKAPRFINLYEQYMGQGRWDDARGVCEMALTTFEEIFGHSHKETLHVVWDLAHISKEQGKHRESKKLMKRAIDGLKG